VTFDGSAGFDGWTYIGSGTGYDADNGNAEAPLEELVSIATPSNTNNYGLDGGAWGWDAAKISPDGHILPNSGAYVGVRYEAPAGQVVTALNVSKFYTNVDANMHLQIADGEGNILADSTRSAPTEMISDFGANSFSSSVVELRWVNTAASTIHFWSSSNGVIIESVELTLDTAPLEGEVTTIYADGGLDGWEYIGSGTAYDVNNGGALGAFKDLAALTSPANTNDFGVDGGTWGWDAAKLNPLNQIQPNSGAYVGFKYEAAEGKMVTAITIPKMYFNVGTSMIVQIADAEGNILAETTRSAVTEMVTDLTAVSLATSSIEVRWVNSAASTINLWGASNAVVFNTVELTTADDPSYQPYDPITHENPARPDTWYGYYHAYTVVQEGEPLSSSPLNWGNQFPEVGNYTNLNHVFPKQGAIDAAVANHSYMLVDVMWQLFEADGNGGYQLKSNYQSAVDGLVTMFEGYENYIGAISPLDEPYHRGVSQSDLETAIAALKTAFPGTPIYTNFAPTEVYSLTGATLPAGADWLAFDLYESGEEQPVEMTDIQGMVDHLKSIKLPEQKLFLVPPSAMNLVATYTDQQLADRINSFYSLMSSDDEIIGMMVFPADGCRQVEFDGIGSTIPLALAAQQAVGAQIAGEVCGDIFNGWYKFDYNFDCHIDMADFAEYAVKWAAE
jgi:hypothetical protein